MKKIREDFPILERKVHGKLLVYLDSAATSQKPRQVIEAVVGFYEKYNSNVHRGVHTLSEEATQLAEAARGKVAEFIGAGSEREIVFTKNATEALNLVAVSFGEKYVGKGEVVLTTVMEHHSDLLPWTFMAKRRGAEVRLIEVGREGRLQLEGRKKKREAGVVVGSLESLLDSKVKVVALTAKSNVLGTINPVKEIIGKVKKFNKKIVVVVDGSHSVPHMETDVRNLGADFLAFSGHKMLGPMGIGVLWGRKELLEEMPPFLLGGDMISEVKINQVEWNRVPYKFEAGTPNVAGVVGLGAAVDYLQGVGMRVIEKHEEELTEYGLEKLLGFEEQGLVTVYGVREAVERKGVLTFNVNGVHAHDTAQILDSEGVAVRSGHHCGQILTERLGVSATCRASFYLYNTKEEIERLGAAVEKVKRVFRV